MNPNSASSPPAAVAALRGHWARMAPREQTLVLAAAAVVGLALLWWVLLAPALQQLRGSAARHAAVDAQLQRMQALQAEALQLKDAPRPHGGEALRTLQTTLAQQLGPAAQMNVAGDRATVTLKGARADALAQWLSQARSTARAVPLEARLVQSTTSSKAAAEAARWDGTLVLALPPQ